MTTISDRARAIGETVDRIKEDVSGWGYIGISHFQRNRQMGS